jgi:exopolysaccharide biosynthesis polyprenyl glycosylphosphotransferase
LIEKEVGMNKYREPATAVATRAEKYVRPVFALRVKEWRVFLLISDLIATSLAVFVALMIWARIAPSEVPFSFMAAHAYWFILLPVVWLFLAQVNDSYRLRYGARIRDTLRVLSYIHLQLIVLYMILFFFVPRNIAPRAFILCFGVLAFTFTAGLRISRTLLMRGQGTGRRVIVVGAGQITTMMMHALKDEAAKEYEVVGCVTSIYDTASLPGNIPILGFGQELPDIVQRYHIAEIIMAYINEIPDDIFDGLMECYHQGAMVVPMPQLYEEVTGRVPIEHIGQRLWSLALPIDMHSFGRKFNGAIKRISDIILSLIGLVIFAPFFPLIALMIKLDSPGPVLFRQERVGQGGRIFTIIKLRSMKADAEIRSGPLWATADDPRTTRIGNILRKTRIDEIPQLVNVLRGDMSIVGPRPERPQFVKILAEQITFYKTRLVVKPGLTGWAQIRFRYGSSLEDALYKLQYDLYYVRHQSLWLDLMIMLRTSVIMLRFQGR